MTISTSRILFSLALAVMATAAAAEQPAFVGTGIDPNTFIPGHPASPRWKLVHANAEHPAVAQARHAQEGAVVDANTFIVQPPATTTWLVRAGSDDVLRVARAR